jgi:hypothetical protein
MTPLFAILQRAQLQRVLRQVTSCWSRAAFA